MTEPAREAQVSVAPGDVSRICPACHTGKEAGHDGDPRHVILGASSQLQEARLPNGQAVQVRVPVDEAYHLDCHAAMGCDHCAEVVEAHDGSVKGKAVEGSGLPNTPDSLVDVEPGEFQDGAGGVLTRVADKAAARSTREGRESESGYKVLDADEAHAHHKRHAAGELTGKEA